MVQSATSTQPPRSCRCCSQPVNVSRCVIAVANSFRGGGFRVRSTTAVPALLPASCLSALRAVASSLSPPPRSSLSRPLRVSVRSYLSRRGPGRSVCRLTFVVSRRLPHSPLSRPSLTCHRAAARACGVLWRARSSPAAYCVEALAAVVTCRQMRCHIARDCLSLTAVLARMCVCVCVARLR